METTSQEPRTKIIWALDDGASDEIKPHSFASIEAFVGKVIGCYSLKDQPEGMIADADSVKTLLNLPSRARDADERAPDDLHFFRGIRDQTLMTAVFDPECSLGYAQKDLGQSNILALLSPEKASENYLRYLREHEVSYCFDGKGGTDLKAALEGIKNNFGLRTLLVTGHSALAKALVKLKLVSELMVRSRLECEALTAVLKAQEDTGALLSEENTVASSEKDEEGYRWFRYTFAPRP
jgi:hypothetical protein